MYNNIYWGHTNFSNVPLIIGEFGIGIPQTEPAARWKYYDFVVNSAYESNTSVALWDAGSSFAPNTAIPYPDPTDLDIIIHAAKGIKNAVPDSTEDSSAPSQWSSAQLFHKLGDPFQDTDLPFVFQGKNLVSISCSDGPCNATLRKNVDYRVNSQNITFTKSFMATVMSSGSSQPGLKANMVFHFDQGAADLRIPAYLWSTPTLAFNSITVTNASAQNDLWIPVTYAGMHKVAMGRAQLTSGDYLVDTWTQWLGPLYKGAIVSLLLPHYISILRLYHVATEFMLTISVPRCTRRVGVTTTHMLRSLLPTCKLL
jgi:endoglucanase